MAQRLLVAPHGVTAGDLLATPAEADRHLVVAGRQQLAPDRARAPVVAQLDLVLRWAPAYAGATLFIAT